MGMDEKNVNDAIELNDDELDAVAGGKFSFFKKNTEDDPSKSPMTSGTNGLFGGKKSGKGSDDPSKAPMTSGGGLFGFK